MGKRPFCHSLFIWKCCGFLVLYKLSIKNVASGKKFQFYATGIKIKLQCIDISLAVSALM